MRRALVIAGLLAAFAAAAALGGSGAGSGNELSAEPGIVTASVTDTAEGGASDAPTTISLALAEQRSAYGDIIALGGALVPAVANREVLIELDAGSGWIGLRSTTTGIDGTFAASMDVTRSGQVRARTIEGNAVSSAAAVTVTAKVRVKPPRGLAFGGARLAARVKPESYTGSVGIRVEKRGVEVASASAQVANGRLRARVPLPGLGRFRVSLDFPELDGLAARVATARVVAKGRTLSAGSSGPDVRGLRNRLAELHVRVPPASAMFSYELRDSVVAFQKAYGLDRTGSVDTATWRALGRVSLIEPRYRGPELHIEVDKTRQILMVVRDGQVSTVLPVSSGATGNTPEGKFEIRWKALATTTWLGSGILYRTMTFYENSVAIHGWSSVPEYPASHGCVRIPIWTADWLYNQSSVGETVYVYQ